MDAYKVARYCHTKKNDHGIDGLFDVNMQTKPEARHLNYKAYKKIQRTLADEGSHVNYLINIPRFHVVTTKTTDINYSTM
jgi:hypothetical protein